MRGQIGFDLLLGLIILTSILGVIGAVVEYSSKTLQTTLNYIVCEEVQGSLAKYYSFLKLNGVNSPGKVEIRKFVLDANIAYSGTKVSASINLGGIGISCSPREVKP